MSSNRICLLQYLIIFCKSTFFPAKDMKNIKILYPIASNDEKKMAEKYLYCQWQILNFETDFLLNIFLGIEMPLKTVNFLYIEGK